MAKKIGLFGGTFNPIHIGHLRCAIEVVEQLALDELKVIPNLTPPHREPPHVNAQDRFAMVKLATEPVAKLTADDRELKREAPSYTIDTVYSIRQELAEHDQLFLIMGQDAFGNLASWHRWQALFNYCHLIVLQRPHVSVKLPKELQQFLTGRLLTETLYHFTMSKGQVIYLQQTPLAISSTQIRQSLKDTKSVQFLLPDTVLDYIKKHQLYLI